ncbi:MAG: hypothetical protein ACPL7I_05990, partial [Myxococcota bacterium]
MRIVHLNYTIAMVTSLTLLIQCTDMPDIRVLEMDNRPPIINKSTITPGGPIIKIDSSCKREFSFAEVTEFDTEDLLYVRWYVDYENIKNYQKSSVIPANDILRTYVLYEPLRTFTYIA